MIFAHSFPFDPTYGYDLPALLRVPPAPEPPGFAAFWRKTYEEARAIDPAPTLKLSTYRVPGFAIHDVAFTSLDRVRISGWLAVPTAQPVRRGLVISHGYGGREGPDALPLLADAAMIFPCARGLSASAQSAFPAVASEHVLHGIASRETYIHRGCAAEVWAAATVLLQHSPAAAARLDYVGTSFGGGIGALAVPWDDRFSSAFLGLPSFGQHPLRLRFPCVGSGEAVRLHAQKHPEAADVLAYFDASVAARHLNRPTLVGAAQFDPAVPPPGQFAVYNALPGPRQLHCLNAGHFDWPGAAGEDFAQRHSLIRFLNSPLS